MLGRHHVSALSPHQFPSRHTVVTATPSTPYPELPDRDPHVGEMVRVRTRHWLVEEVISATKPDESSRVRLACADDDAQGQELEVFHHAASSHRGRYGIESKFTRAVRDLCDRFEQRLFLSATSPSWFFRACWTITGPFAVGASPTPPPVGGPRRDSSWWACSSACSLPSKRSRGA